MFRGSIVALVTPFKEDFDIDFEAYGRLIDWHLESGTDGLVPCGCTGEAATLTHDEQIQCIKYTVERVAGRVPVIAGTGSNSTREALSLTRKAKELGADAALLITPYYNKPTPAGQMAHYTTIARQVDLPIVLYNVPGRTGTKMLPATIADIHNAAENIVAVKEACGSVDQVSEIRSLSDITVLSGDDSLTLPMMVLGAKGVISVASNLLPGEVTAMVHAALDGDWERARAAHYRLYPLFRDLFIDTNPIPVKTALTLMSRVGPTFRLPLCEPPESVRDQVSRTLRSLNLL